MLIFSKWSKLYDLSFNTGKIMIKTILVLIIVFGTSSYSPETALAHSFGDPFGIPASCLDADGSGNASAGHPVRSSVEPHS